MDHQHTMQSEQIPNRFAAFDAKEQNEFMNLNIKQNASDSEDESQQRIFQFSPLSSKKQQDEEESQE